MIITSLETMTNAITNSNVSKITAAIKLVITFEKGRCHAGTKHPHVTVADDLALIAEDKSDAQVMVWDADNSAGRERYCIHPTKSHILWYTQRKKKDAELDIFMAGEKVDTPSQTVHLGIVSNTSGNADIEGK